MAITPYYVNDRQSGMAPVISSVGQTKMKTSIIQDVDGLSIVFKENIFMYYHELVIIDNANNIEISCESLPKENVIGIWLDESSIKYYLSIIKWLNLIDESFKVFYNGKIKYEKINDKKLKKSAQQGDAPVPASGGLRA